MRPAPLPQQQGVGPKHGLRMDQASQPMPKSNLPPESQEQPKRPSGLTRGPPPGMSCPGHRPQRRAVGPGQASQRVIAREVPPRSAANKQSVAPGPHSHPDRSERTERQPNTRQGQDRDRRPRGGGGRKGPPGFERENQSRSNVNRPRRGNRGSRAGNSRNDRNDKDRKASSKESSPRPNREGKGAQRAPRGRGPRSSRRGKRNGSWRRD